MKKMLTLTLVLALVSLMFAPVPAFAWGGHSGYRGGNYGYQGGGYYHRHNGDGGGISTGAAVAIGLGGVLLGAVLDHALNQPGVVVAPGYPQPSVVVAPQPYQVYGGVYGQPVCLGQLTQEYGWAADPYGGPAHYVPTGTWFCNGQVVYR